MAGSAAFAATNGLALRIGSGEANPQRYLEYGYNAAVLGDLNQLARFDSVYPGAIADGSALRQRIDQHRRKFAQASQRAAALGLAVCLLADEVSLPTPIVERLPKSARKRTDAALFDFASDEFWRVYRAKYREVLGAWPRVAYVIVRTGENYSHPDEGFTGHTVSDGKLDAAYFTHMQRLIEETRKVVVDEFGRQLVWRTWDLGNAGFHADPAVYDRVLAGLPNRKGLIFSLKHTQTDFWLYNDFNPMIGRGQVDQIVEFQCAREYEGKGAFPNYLGPLHADALRRARDRGAMGAWIWDFGGGWGGPFLKSDRWVRLNIATTSRLAQNPDLSPRDLAREWAASEFGPTAAANIAELAMLSGECVRKLLYLQPYARNHPGWKPSLNLMRDDLIRGEPLPTLYRACDGALPEVLAEKDEAVALADRMRELLARSRASIVAERGQPVFQEAAASLDYLASIARVVRYYVGGMFLYYRWLDTRQAADAGRARGELLAWRAAWRQYQSEVPTLPGVASLYRSQNAQDANSAKGAMADLCEAALRSLPAPTPTHSG